MEAVEAEIGRKIQIFLGNMNGGHRRRGKAAVGGMLI
jgi:hypothetical protein